jgi:hypothetical protein
MKTFLKLTLTVILMVNVSILLGQVQPGDPNYDQMKEQGLIAQPEQVTPPSAPLVTMEPLDNGNRNGGLLIPRDGTFTLAMSPNDDGSSSLITLPFTFCLYGDNYTTCYINNNGNVSFGSPYGTYSSTGFPVSGFPMVAPFWADVDTRSCGSVWYKIQTNPNRLIVVWELTGYYSNQCDKFNTFELVMTDGNDPFIGMGKNVAFSYAEMSWTTGSASGGSGGFGGTPATVGINKGDGVDYALLGRFDHPGTDYDGPDGNADGVDWLDEKDFVFDGCAGIIPPQTPISNWALFLGIGLILAFAVIRYRRMI